VSLRCRPKAIVAHTRALPLPHGEPVAVDIEIWPFTAQFHPGERLRLTVAGADIYRWPHGAYVAGHDLLVNTAEHVLHTGGDYDARLLLPIVPADARRGHPVSR
jgi:predicted acyl esterase